MKKVHVRQVFDSEMLDILYQANTYAFSASPPLRDRPEWEEIIKARAGVDYFALFEDGTAVSNAATTRLTQHIRGKIFSGGGVWAVATKPEARRKGYCRQVMAGLFASEQAAGRAVSLLYPFRGSFYERLGYTTFPQPRKAIFKPETLEPLLRKDLRGEMRIQPIAEAFDDYVAFIKGHQGRIHGFANFDYGNRAQTEKNNSWWVAQAVFDGQAEGLMLYDLRGEEVMQFRFRAIRFYYSSSRARYLMLQWIARHIDQANQVEIWLAPFEQPETWLSDIRPQLEPVFFAPMGRVVRLEALAGMQTGRAKFTARVRDPLCPWNEGVWNFDGTSGRLEISKADSAELELEIQGLNALVYGTNDPGDFALLGWGRVPDQSRETLLEIFPRKLPFLHEIF